MISIIVYSVNKERFSDFEEISADSIGIPFKITGFDNSELSGSYTAEWVKDTNLFPKKRADKLPVYLTPSSKNKRIKNEIKAIRNSMQLLRRDNEVAFSDEIKKSLSILRSKYIFHFDTMKILFKYFFLSKV